ncbi:F0F1 ATP synthase subunit A [Haliangium ochraceum]|uniref:ATP synthase subunit a n=1 Tax=Haliangium ochraceum (strain DSM 14365 / JCM 11303 / SMP-2) TaxID=502025 RepID=D0LNR0_HALO1|nr:F0F1 ATP synthase subunit A [Haliangium ochraceum]ACY16965.1 ATP synthase F0, A subunit [Haliangium ochraceum DSM 14365]
MGEHGTWFDLLYKFHWWQDAAHSLEHQLGRDWQWLLFGPTHWTLTHVMVAATVVLFVIFGASRFRAGVVGKGEDGLVPPRNFNLRHMFELLCDAILGMMTGVMGEKNAKRFFPLIGSLALFILFSNLMALIPGFAPATDTLKTNLALAVLVFLLTHYYGFKEHGAGYIKQFLGPMLALAPLIFLIEVISHLVRPASLALRLMGNMAADHKVIFAFFALVPAFVPVPFYFLGILVCVVQTLVFCLLSMVYISMAISHDH